MIGSLLGIGAVAEVFEWGDDRDRVLKLFNKDQNWGTAQYEVCVTKAIYRAGGPAPLISDVVVIDDRIGIIMTRYEGPTLLKLLIEGESPPVSVAETLADILYALHALNIEAEVRTFRNWALGDVWKLRSLGIPQDVINKANDTVMTLPEGGCLCHGDLHPGNIVMTHEGPRIIDWINAVRGNPWFDVSRLYMSLGVYEANASALGLEQSVVDDIRSQMVAAFLRKYAVNAEINAEDLADAIRPYNIVLAATRMNESSSSKAERDCLIDYIREAS